MLKKLILTIILSVLLLAPGLVWAVDYGLEKTAKSSGLSVKYSANLPTLLGNIIGSALSLVGIIFFILMVYGGFLWMQARGNEEDSKKALNTIFAAIIGIIIILASYALTNFVFNNAGLGANVTTPTNSGSLCGKNNVGDVILKDKFNPPNLWFGYECADSTQTGVIDCRPYTDYADKVENGCTGQLKCCLLLAGGSGTSKCGNGTIDSGEECDMQDKACASLDSAKWSGGNATCGADCKGYSDTSKCVPFCNKLNPCSNSLCEEVNSRCLQKECYIGCLVSQCGNTIVQCSKGTPLYDENDCDTLCSAIEINKTTCVDECQNT